MPAGWPAGHPENIFAGKCVTLYHAVIATSAQLVYIIFQALKGGLNQLIYFRRLTNEQAGPEGQAPGWFMFSEQGCCHLPVPTLNMIMCPHGSCILHMVLLFAFYHSLPHPYKWRYSKPDTLVRVYLKMYFLANFNNLLKMRPVPTESHQALRLLRSTLVI
jgi:hypothetical protein